MRTEKTTSTDRTNRRLWWGVIGAIGLILAAVVIWRQRQVVPTHPPSGQVAHRDEAVREVKSRNPGFVGPQACVACHAERVAEFKQTRHFLASVPTQPETMSADLPEKSQSVLTRDSRLRFETSRQGPDFLQTAVQITHEGERRVSSRLAFSYGARGTFDEIFFAWHGDRLFELPLCWMHPTQEWGVSLFNPFGSGHFGREVPVRCLECHNTWIEHVPGTVNEYRPDHFVMGVTCEVCHGPGREHVSFHQQHPADKMAHQISRPSRLSRDLQLELCAQCHSNAVKSRGPAFRFRPGDRVADFFQTLSVNVPEDDHVSNQLEYLKQSRCFQQSETMTCTTCHNPHQPRGESNAGAKSCHQCHQPPDCHEHERLPMEVRGDCIGCHMPKRTKPQIHFWTTANPYVMPGQRWSHRIGIDRVARDQVLYEWHRSQSTDESQAESQRLARALGEHWLTTAKRLKDEHRYLAAIDACRQAERFQPAEEIPNLLAEAIATQTKLDEDWPKALQQIAEHQFDEAVVTLNDILKVKPQHAAARGRLGTVYAVKNQHDLAREHWRAVAALDPNDQYGENMLGWLAYLQGRYAESSQHYARADEIEPFNAQTNFQLAMSLAKLNRMPEAIKRFQQTLIIEPQHGEACRQLSQALRQQGRIDEAIQALKNGVEQTRAENLPLLVTLAELCAESGDTAEAAIAATKALKLANSSNEPLNRLLRRRLEEWKAKAP